MSTVVVVRKNGRAAIAADTLTTIGEMGLRAAYKAVPEKVFKLGASFLAVTGNPVTRLVLESIARKGSLPELSDRGRIFEWLRGLQAGLKDEYFVNPKEDEKDSYESTQMRFVLANPYGIFGVYSDRDVYEYSRFWAMGSGDEFALGAMAAVYDRESDVATIARTGVSSAIEFDRSSGGPITLETVELVEPARAVHRKRSTKRR